MSAPDDAPPVIWTIGHSTHPMAEFVDMLRAHDIQGVADVRRFAGSRKNPQFGPESLAASLRGAGIAYETFPELGGRRKPNAGSANTVWRNEAFRGYADYMETPEFREGAGRLAALATGERTAIMCSESVWWRCHRSLIGDWFKAHGWTVLHIMGTGRATEHPYTAPARVVDGALYYGAGRGPET